MPLCATVDEAKELMLPDHWMRKWFIAALQLELQENRKGLQSYANLVKEIPASAIGVVQMAVGQFDLGPSAAMSLIYFLIILALSWVFYTVMTRDDEQPPGGNQ